MTLRTFPSYLGEYEACTKIVPGPTMRANDEMLLEESNVKVIYSSLTTLTLPQGEALRMQLG